MNRNAFARLLPWALVLGLLFPPGVAATDEWSLLVTPLSRGDFPELRPGKASYAFGWSGITAGTADVRLDHSDSATIVLSGNGRTVGLARTLWRFDVDYRSRVRSDTLTPAGLHQEENVRGKRLVTDLDFSPEGVTRTRTEANKAPSTKEFPGENLHDLFSALLYLRSQPMKEHNVYRLAVYPATSAYLATVTVLGREKIQIRPGSYNALKLDLKVQRISKKGRLEPYKKLKRATAWVSDDNDRLLLRVEGQILVGSVTAELQSIRFD